MSGRELQLENDLINLRHENTSLKIVKQSYEDKIKQLEEANLRLADRNWVLQSRVVEQATWPK